MKWFKKEPKTKNDMVEQLAAFTEAGSLVWSGNYHDAYVDVYPSPTVQGVRYRMNNGVLSFNEWQFKSNIDLDRLAIAINNSLDKKEQRAKDSGYQHSMDVLCQFTKATNASA